MRRALAILPLAVAIILLIVGVRLLLKASTMSTLGAASSAIGGVGCLVAAAVVAGRPATRLLTYPISALLGHLFYPEDHYTDPPPALLASLRQLITEGRFKPAVYQVEQLLKAYPRNAALYHVWALVEAARGRDWRPVSAEAKQMLTKKTFGEYETLLRTDPPRRTTGFADGSESSGT